MTWLKLDDGFFLHPKVIGLPVGSKVLYLAALCWSSSALTDGMIPTAALGPVATTAGAKPRDVGPLVAAGLWTEHADGWQIANYGDHQRSAQQVREKRAGNASRQSRWRERNALRDASVTGQESESHTDTETDYVSRPREPVENQVATTTDDDVPTAADLEWARAEGYSDHQLAHDTERWRERNSRSSVPLRDPSAAWRAWIGKLPVEPDIDLPALAAGPTVARCACGAPLLDGGLCGYCDTATIEIDLTEAS